MDAETPTIQSWGELIHVLGGKSKYHVERAFDALPMDEKLIILSIRALFFESDDPKIHKLANEFLAKIKKAYLRDQALDGSKLHHYKSKEKEYIAKAFRAIRKTSKDMPSCITLRDFMMTDYHAGAENEQISDEMAQ